MATRLKPSDGPLTKKTKRKRLRLEDLRPASVVAKKMADRACFPIYHGMTCYLCPSTEGSAAHHIIPRSESSYFRHHICNLIPLCQSCHCRVENSAAARHLMMLAIRSRDRRWCDWIDWACNEKFNVVKDGIRPDFVAAAVFWRDHELSGETVEEHRNKILAERKEKP